MATTEKYGTVTVIWNEVEFEKTIVFNRYFLNFTKMSKSLGNSLVYFFLVLIFYDALENSIEFEK